MKRILPIAVILASLGFAACERKSLPIRQSGEALDRAAKLEARVWQLEARTAELEKRGALPATR